MMLILLDTDTEVCYNSSMKLEERDNVMASLYRDGQTLQEIGDQFGLTKQRVQQILKGNLSSREGGAAVRSTRRIQEFEAYRDRESLRKRGLTVEGWRLCVDSGITTLYKSQRNNALRRGITWELTLGDWVRIWHESGYFHERGRCKGQYVMGRHDDRGPYSVENCYITKAEENIAEARSQDQNGKGSTMTALYGCKRTQNHEVFFIAKFDENLSIETSYLVGPKTCQCQGWQKKKTCRHLTMRTMFMMNHHTDDGWFLDFENRRWREYPNLLVDGTAKDFKESLDTLALGDGGYRGEPMEKLSLNSAGQTPAPAVVGGVSLSSPAAPEAKGDAQSTLPSGVEFTIPRRRGL